MSFEVTEFVKTFIETHIEDIENNNFEKLYGDIPLLRHSHTGILTDVLLASGINPLEHMTYIPQYYLTGSKQLSIDIPENVTTILENVFVDSSIRKFTLPKHITDIRDGAFNTATRLIELDISEYQDNIPSMMCYGCTNLRKVILPNTVEYIASNSFSLCPNLEEFVINQNRDYVFNIGVSQSWKKNGINIPVRCTDGWVTISSYDGAKLG